MTGCLPILVLAAAVFAAAAAPAAAQVPEPSGYRLEDYRAAVPSTLAGGMVVSTEEAHALWQEGSAVFVDVLPRPPRPNLPEGAFWRPPERKGIPGGAWLANTGFGALAPDVQAYFETELARLTDNNRERPVVFYCLRDCWMSWNAAKRALELGYGNVFWYPDGTDGWAEAGLPLKPSEPVPLAGSADRPSVN